MEPSCSPNAHFVLANKSNSNVFVQENCFGHFFTKIFLLLFYDERIVSGLSVLILTQSSNVVLICQSLFKDKTFVMMLLENYFS